MNTSTVQIINKFIIITANDLLTNFLNTLGQRPASYTISNYPRAQSAKYVFTLRIGKALHSEHRHAITKFSCLSVCCRADAKSHKFSIKIWFPELRMTANYNIDGKLLMVPLSGEGTIHGNFCK